MIVQESYITEDNRELRRTYSDTDHQIKKVGTSEVYNEAIDTMDSRFEYIEVDEYIEFEGPENYDEILKQQEQLHVVSHKINHIGLTNKEALTVKDFFPKWVDKIGKTVEQGFVILHSSILWRCRQTHIAQADWMPSLDSASLWEVIEVEHSGTLDDPIPYSAPMEIFNSKYYTEDGITYLCTRDSGIALSHPLSALVGVYVDKI